MDADSIKYLYGSLQHQSKLEKKIHIWKDKNYTADPTAVSIVSSGIPFLQQ